MKATGRTLFLLVCVHFITFLPAFSQKIIKQFFAPGTNSRGLAWDGTNLWCADETDKAIYKVNASSGGVISSISFSIKSGRG